MEANEKALVDAINAEVGKKLDAVKAESLNEVASLKAELEANKAKSQEYDKIVQDPSKTREERRHAEDQILS